MNILGIETSCDETACSVVQDGVTVLASAVASSQELHIKTQGIVPEVAAREQIKLMIPVLDSVLGRVQPKQVGPVQVGPSWEMVDAIAVTTHPGLIGSLLVGIETARTLAWVKKLPIVPVDHVLAHIYANWVSGELPNLPAIALVVSGGHTELILIKNHGDLVHLGATRDDSVGETFDKVARVLGLPYPGGPSIEKTALEGGECKLKFPSPMINSADYDFSYSGLKTAVVTRATGLNPGSQGSNLNAPDIAYAFQEAALKVLVEKSIRALEEFDINSMIVAGGVSANKRLREMFEERLPVGVSLHFPKLEYCTDNAAMTASYAFFNYHPISWQDISIGYNH